METVTLKSNKSFQFVPANLFVRASLNGKPLCLRAEAIANDRLFLIFKEYVAPRAVFHVQLFLAEDDHPLSATMTAAYIERSWEGYRVQAQVSCISIADDGRWQRFYRNALAGHRLSYSASFRKAQFLHRQHITALRGVLPEKTVTTLGQLGVSIRLIDEVPEALAMAQGGQTDLVVATLDDHGLEAATRVRALQAVKPMPQVLLLSHHPSCPQIERGMHCGASMVVALPCCASTLTGRIVALLDSGEGRATSKAASAAAPQLAAATPSLPSRLFSGLLSLLSFSRSQAARS